MAVIIVSSAAATAASAASAAEAERRRLHPEIALEEKLAVAGVAVANSDWRLSGRVEEIKAERKEAQAALCQGAPLPPGADKIANWAQRRDAACSLAENKAPAPSSGRRPGI